VSFTTKVLSYVVFGNVGAASTQALALRLAVVPRGWPLFLQFAAAPVSRAVIRNFAMVLAHT
jgi:hypothetical protein